MGISLSAAVVARVGVSDTYSLYKNRLRLSHQSRRSSKSAYLLETKRRLFFFGLVSYREMAKWIDYGSHLVTDQRYAIRRIMTDGREVPLNEWKK